MGTPWFVQEDQEPGTEETSRLRERASSPREPASSWAPPGVLLQIHSPRDPTNPNSSASRHHGRISVRRGPTQPTEPHLALEGGCGYTRTEFPRGQPAPQRPRHTKLGGDDERKHTRRASWATPCVHLSRRRSVFRTKVSRLALGQAWLAR
jgi:hypothetical protein